MLQAALRLSDDKKRRIVENRRRLLLNLEALLRKQNMVRLLSGSENLERLVSWSRRQHAVPCSQPHNTKDITLAGIMASRSMKLFMCR